MPMAWTEFLWKERQRSQVLTGTAQAARLARRFRPRVETLEDRVQLGDTLLGLSVVALGGLGTAFWGTPLALAANGPEHEGQDPLFSSWEATESLGSMAVTRRPSSEESSTAMISDRSPSDLVPQTAAT